ncbi:MAG: dihydroneopterin aldolase [Flavobacteriales bacterium]|nr:dihydroneopterin aldolase [Flavobacteriales bacterium]
MGLIEVGPIRVFAFHGCLPEEALIGGQYRVEVTVSGDFSKAEAQDDLRETVDYGRVVAIVQEQMAIRSRLIEHAAARILDALKQEWPLHGPWRVRVTKEHPPVSGDAESARYTVEG